jgi:carbon monoxide dehydrogenase subunit G
MKMEQSFEVEAPIDVVWAALIDIERVAPCLPGANITEREDDGTYKGTFEVKLGPTTASYRGVLKIEEADEATHRAVLNARGTDKRGQGGATATIVNTLTATEGGGTHVHADTDFTITGRLARFGRGGMIEDISNRLLREFASCLQANLVGGGGGGGEEPASPTAAAAEAGATATPTDAAGSPPGDEPAVQTAAPEAAAAGAEVAAAVAGTTSGDSPASGTAPGTSPGSAVPPRPAAPPQPMKSVQPQGAKPVNGLALVFGVLYERLAKLFGRPGRKRRR